MTRLRKDRDRAATAQFEELTELPFDRAVTRLILAGEPKDRLTLREITIGAGLAGRFRGNVESALSTVLQQGNGRVDVCSHYVETSLKPGQVEYIDLDEPRAADLSPSLAPWRALGQVGAFKDRDDEYVKALRYYGVVVETDDGSQAVAFRAFSPKQELGRSRFFGVIARGGVYDEVESRIFLFDDLIDCVLFGSHLFILRKTFFQQIFRYFEVLERRARRALTKLPSLVPIANFPDLEADAVGQAKRVKLASIAERAYVRKKKPIPIERWQEVIQEFGLAVRVLPGPEGEPRLVYDASRPWEFYRLLDDDYLVSDLTDRGYEATGKRPHALVRDVKKKTGAETGATQRPMEGVGRKATRKRTA